MSENKHVRIDHPGMMGDGTEEQNLGQAGDPSKRITEKEVEEAFEGRPADGASDRGAPDLDRDEGGDLLSHFVRRTDNSYAGVEDKSLLGEDIGDDEVDEDGEPI